MTGRSETQLHRRREHGTGSHCVQQCGLRPLSSSDGVSLAKGVPFREKNVARAPSAVQDLMRMGMRVLPVLVIGNKRLSGFNPKAIDAALAG